MSEILPRSQSLPSGYRLHEFEILRELGSGGFGITYLARDQSLDRDVVIKENLPMFAYRDPATSTVHPKSAKGEDADLFAWSLESFINEAKTLAKFQHPNIVKVLRVFEANNTAYFAMPYVDGETLDHIIARRSKENKPFTEQELRSLLMPLLDALEDLHDSHVYHRDIKPSNILITAKGIPVLIDFGAARQMVSERSHTVVESPGYTPFEQLQSRGHVGPWSDLYALAGTFYKAITFATPPKSADRMGREDPFIPLGTSQRAGDLDQGFRNGLDLAMAIFPNERPQTAADWRQILLNGGTNTPRMSVKPSEETLPVKLAAPETETYHPSTPASEPLPTPQLDATQTTAPKATSLQPAKKKPNPRLELALGVLLALIGINFLSTGLLMADIENYRVRIFGEISFIAAIPFSVGLVLLAFERNFRTGGFALVLATGLYALLGYNFPNSKIIYTDHFRSQEILTSPNYHWLSITMGVVCLSFLWVFRKGYLSAKLTATEPARAKPFLTTLISTWIIAACTIIVGYAAYSAGPRIHREIGTLLLTIWGVFSLVLLILGLVEWRKSSWIHGAIQLTLLFLTSLILVRAQDADSDSPYWFYLPAILALYFSLHITSLLPNQKMGKQ